MRKKALVDGGRSKDGHYEVRIVGARHSLEIYVFYLAGASATRITLPDYTQNALGRVTATQPDLHCLSEPKRWDGNKLDLELRFSVSDPARGPRLLLVRRHVGLSAKRLLCEPSACDSTQVLRRRMT